MAILPPQGCTLLPHRRAAQIEAGGDDVVTLDYTRLLLVSSRLLVRAVQGS